MFERLGQELALWQRCSRVAQFWWRDDDAQLESAPLNQLLDISTRYDAPLSLAVIPDGVGQSLVDAVADMPSIHILQHGYNHCNYAPAELRKMELGWHRPEEQIRKQLGTGLERLRHMFGEQFVPVMVPPWNRIDSQLVALLPALGFKGLSTLGPRLSAEAVPGMQQLNVHVDIIDWKQGRCFAGVEACEAQIVTHLSAKREQRVDCEEPTGIMSHHRVQDDDSVAFLARLFEYLQQHPSAELCDVVSVFTSD